MHAPHELLFTCVYYSDLHLCQLESLAVLFSRNIIFGVSFILFFYDTKALFMPFCLFYHNFLCDIDQPEYCIEIHFFSLFLYFI